VISAGWETLFGKRYGMRLTGVSVSNAMEASLGAIWAKIDAIRGLSRNHSRGASATW
jgi:hypothetical protein